MDTVISAATTIVPTISFCGAVQWWKWCRQRPKSGFFRWLFRP